MTTTMTIDGSELRELARDLRHVSGTVNEAAREALDDFAADVEDEYSRRLPPDVSGQTRDGVASEPAHVKSPIEVRVIVGNTHFVARYLEDGTVKMAPQPALDPAVRAMLPKTFPRSLTPRLRQLADRRLLP